MTQKQAEHEIDHQDDDNRCDKCGRAVGFSNLKRHRCRKQKKVYYFCEACFTIHGVEQGEPGYVVDFY